MKFELTTGRRLTLGVASLIALGCAEQRPSPIPYTLTLPAHFPQPRIPADNPLLVARVELGRRLFYDTRLSQNETQSCATCHEQARAFTDGRTVSVGSTGQHTPRNSMAIVNVAYNFTQTWANPEVVSLEQQALNPIFGDIPVELGFHGLEPELLARLTSVPEYRAWFREAFPNEATIAMPMVVAAIASFERTMISANSPFDRFQSGQTNALSASEQRGLALFNGERLQCFHCHGGFNFSGETAHAQNVLAEQAYENNGLYNVDGEGAYPEGNRGLFEHTGEPLDMGRFKAPTLRNISETAPYMHDGSIATLDEVVSHYARGGRLIESGPLAGDGRTSPRKSHFVDGFVLTPEERADLLSFLAALSDPDFLTNPAFANPWR